MKNKLLLLLSLSCGLSMLPSCVDNNYDLDDMDESAEFSPGGINIPLGDVKTLFVQEELNRNEDHDIKVDPDGTLYWEYDGSFALEAPRIEKPTDFSIRLESPVTNTLPPFAGGVLPPDYTLNIASGNLTYEMGEAEHSSIGDGWDIAIDSIAFSSCDISVALNLDGIGISDNGNEKGNITLTITFPDNLFLKETHSSDSRTITYSDGVYTLEESIALSEFGSTYNSYILDPIVVAAYKYENGINNAITYSATITSGSNTQVYTTDENGYFYFDLNFSTQNIEPYLIAGTVENLEQEVSEEHVNISNLRDIFDEDLDVLVFENPSFTMNVATNIGTDFSLKVKELNTANEYAQTPNYDIEDLTFEKPQNIGDIANTTYLLANIRPDTIEPNYFRQLNVNDAMNIRPIPNELNYDLLVSATSNKAYFLYDNVQLTANYRLKVPFSFTEASLHFTNKLNDVFTSEWAEELFYTPETFSVVIDSIFAQVGGIDVAPNSASVTVGLKVLDEYGQDVGMLIQPQTISNGAWQNASLIIDMQNANDVEKMQRARSIEFDFAITGDNVSIKNTDFITLRKVKFKSNKGISFEF